MTVMRVPGTFDGAGVQLTSIVDLQGGVGTQHLAFPLVHK